MSAYPYCVNLRFPNVINVIRLYRAFVEVCGRYEERVRTDTTVRVRFERMFDKYGSISTWQAYMEPVRMS
jgi:hypothetical protein